MFNNVKDFLHHMPRVLGHNTHQSQAGSIRTPFLRIAMDAFGVLEKSSTGNQYILVICYDVKRFPEAFPPQSIKT